MRVFASMVCLAMLSGCALRAPLARVAIEQNELVAQATNQMMLANIVRAEKREPLHFTSISALHGNVSLSAGAALGSTFASDSIVRTRPGVGAAAAAGDVITIPGGSVTPSVSGAVATNPSFDLAVNDSQDFYQGFLKPIEPEIVAHYLDDGWPPELITYLLVRRFDFVAKATILKSALGKAVGSGRDAAEPTDGDAGPPFVKAGDVVASFVNDPDPGDGDRDRPGFTKVTDFIRCFQLTTVGREEPETQLFSVGKLSALSGLEQIDGVTFDAKLRPDGDAVVVREGGVSTALKLVDRVSIARRAEDDDDPKAREEVAGARKACNAFTRATADDRSGSGAADLRFTPAVGSVEAAEMFKTNVGPEHHARYAGDERQPEDESRPGISGEFYLPSPDRPRQLIRVPVDVFMTLRSPEALIYFLGQYLRVAEERRFRTSVADSRTKCANIQQPFLVIRQDDDVKHAELSVRIDGHVYSIPNTALPPPPPGSDKAGCDGRSMQVLGLVEQLYNLHKSSKDKLGTQSVHLIP